MKTQSLVSRFERQAERPANRTPGNVTSVAAVTNTADLSSTISYACQKTQL